MYFHKLYCCSLKIITCIDNIFKELISLRFYSSELPFPEFLWIKNKLLFELLSLKILKPAINQNQHYENNNQHF